MLVDCFLTGRKPWYDADLALCWDLKCGSSCIMISSTFQLLANAGYAGDIVVIVIAKNLERS